MAGETPTPPQPGGLRGFWKRRSRWGKVGLIAGAVFVTFVAIGLAVPAPDDSENTSAQVADEETTEPETTTEEATTEADPTTEETTTEEAEEAADDGDTGRMSEGEYDFFTSALTEVDEEIDQFATTMQKCGVLFQALQLADGSECVDEAYSGFKDKALLAYAEADDRKSDVAKDCLAKLTAFQTRLTIYATYVDLLYEAASTLQAKKTIKLSRQAGRQTRVYVNARDVVLLACAPQ